MGFRLRQWLSNWHTPITIKIEYDVSVLGFFLYLPHESSQPHITDVSVPVLYLPQKNFFCLGNYKPDIVSNNYFSHFYEEIWKIVILTHRHIYFYDRNAQSSK